MSKLIKKIAKEMGCDYVYDDWGRINLYADRIKGDVLVAEVIPMEGNINTKHMPVMVTSKSTMVAFLTPCNLDFSGDEVGNKIDAMLEVCKEFLQRYSEAEGVDILPDSITYNNVLDFLDANMCGVRVTIDITDLGGCA